MPVVLAVMSASRDRPSARPDRLGAASAKQTARVLRHGREIEVHRGDPSWREIIGHVHGVFGVELT